MKDLLGHELLCALWKSGLCAASPKSLWCQTDKRQRTGNPVPRLNRKPSPRKPYVDKSNQGSTRTYSGRVYKTPIITSRLFNEAAGREVFFKCENFQRPALFKIRGATNKIRSLSDQESRAVSWLSLPAIMPRRLLCRREAESAYSSPCPTMRPGESRRPATMARKSSTIGKGRSGEVCPDLAERERLAHGFRPTTTFDPGRSGNLWALSFAEEVADLDAVLRPVVVVACLRVWRPR
jgi:hypothetical protein